MAEGRSLRAPGPLDVNSRNLSLTWKRWKEEIQLYIDLAVEDDAANRRKTLLYLMGENARKVYGTLTFVNGENAPIEEKDRTAEQIVAAFESYCNPKKNETVERYKFFTRGQSSGETFDEYVTDLRTLASECGFGDIRESLIRDRILCGILDGKVRERLLRESNLSLAKCEAICRAAEVSKQSIQTMEQTAVHMVRKNPRSWKGDPKRKGTTPRTRTYQATQGSRACDKCGRSHMSSETCPANGQSCRKCGKRNHFAAVCRSKKPTVQDVRAVSENLEEFHIETVSKTQPVGDQAFVDLHVEEMSRSLRCKLDTGAQVNVLPEKVWQQLKHKRVMPATTRLYGYGNVPLEVRGKCRLTCSYKGKSGVLEFYIVRADAAPVLSLKACLSLQLIKLVLTVQETQTAQSILEEYKDVFEGIGQLPGEHTIQLDHSVPPKVHPPRRIPVSLRDPLKAELDRMERLGVIRKVDEPTDWVNSLVVVEKPRTDKLRVCLDPRDLNKAIKREHYQLPTLEDITTRLAGSKYFSVVDARSGYWQVKLDEESSKLTTFNTVYGRYCFTRLPFGIHSAQEVFQKQMDKIFQELKGVEVIVDDILVHGRTEEEHNSRFRAMLQRARDKCVKLNPEKVVVAAPEVGYFGHILTKDGLKPDPKKVRAITSMKAPTNKAEVMTMLGMVNYLAKFTPNLSEVTAPLRELLREDIEFVWDNKRKQAFADMKKVVAEASTLSYYDPHKEATLQVDASKYGLGAVLMQEGRPVAYASKSLNTTEVNYAQIEKELYAIVFGCERFHQYVYGRSVTVESDHKPLEAITRKPLSSAPAMQRMLLRLQKYDLVVQHRPGKDIPVADALSRLYLEETDDRSETFEAQVHMVKSNLPVSSRRMEEVRRETREDSQLVTLKGTIKEGWPDTKDKCDPQIAEYWNHRDELTVHDDVIFKGQKILVPRSMRKEMLDILHEGHLGQEKTKARARDILFWPGLNAQIDERIQRCAVCQEHRSSNVKEPMTPHPVPQRPWQKVATDLFHWDGKDFILIVDYYSKYIEFHKLERTRSTDVIIKLKKTFATHGIPEEVISDNGPQYASEEFARFAQTWSFTHTTSSPHYPQSNGLAERAVQTMKRLLQKARADNKDPFLALLEYRNTPVDNTLPSPAQLLMSRRLRTRLPTTNEQLTPKSVNHDNVRRQLEQKQQRQKTQYDKSSRPLPPISTGEEVRIQQQNKTWTPATVIQQTEQPRSWLVETPDGVQYRRNRKHLQKIKESSVDTSDESALDESPTPVLNDTAAQPYITRSGRAVKPPLTEQTGKRTVILDYDSGLEEVSKAASSRRLRFVHINFCKCEPELVSLVRYGLWGASENPQTAFAVSLLEWLVILGNECHVSVEGFCNSIRWKNNLSLPEQNGEQTILLDGNFGLVRKASSGTSIVPPHHGSRLFLEDEVDCNHFQAGSKIRSTNRQENLGYPVLLIQQLVQQAQLKNIRLRVVYDIGCVLEAHLKKLLFYKRMDKAGKMQALSEENICEVVKQAPVPVTEEDMRRMYVKEQENFRQKKNQAPPGCVGVHRLHESAQGAWECTGCMRVRRVRKSEQGCVGEPKVEGYFNMDLPVGEEGDLPYSLQRKAIDAVCIKRCAQEEIGIVKEEMREVLAFLIQQVEDLQRTFINTT
ncbi:hypothetical protein Bbelb_109550 [Branchiostoma belcheri]|nr:hypothetical protein Bbelb_109550 [Branchiostoma belcheri]